MLFECLLQHLIDWDFNFSCKTLTYHYSVLTYIARGHVWWAARRGARGGHFLPIKNSSGPTQQAKLLLDNDCNSSLTGFIAQVQQDVLTYHMYIFVYNIQQVIQHLDELLFRNITEYQIYATFSLHLHIMIYNRRFSF